MFYFSLIELPKHYYMYMLPGQQNQMRRTCWGRHLQNAHKNYLTRTGTKPTTSCLQISFSTKWATQEVNSVYGLFLYITVKSLSTHMCIITTLITDQKDYVEKKTLMIQKGLRPLRQCFGRPIQVCQRFSYSASQRSGPAPLGNSMAHKVCVGVPWEAQTGVFRLTM